MNPQPSNTTVNIFTGLFLFFFFYFFFNGKRQNVDMLDLGIIYDKPTQTVSQPINYTISFANAPAKTVRKPTKKQQRRPINTQEVASVILDETPEEVVTPKNTKPTIQDLAKDCYETLVAIGYKKREAKKLVEDYLKNNTNPDIIQFIKDITFKA